MPYIYKEALGIRVEDSCKYVSVDIANETLANLTNNFKQLFLKVEHTQTLESVVFDFLEHIQGISNTYQTVDEFLVSNGDTTILGNDLGLLVKTKYATYHDVWSTVLNDVKPAKLGVHPSNPYDPVTFKDLLLGLSSETDLTYDYFVDNCIFTVNGLVHRANLSQHGVYIQDGRISKDLCNNTDLGMINFKDVGGIETISIDDTLIIPDQFDKPWYTTKLKLNKDLRGKTLLLSIGGYLHVLDDVYDIINPIEGIIGINFNNYQLLQKYFDSKHMIDLRELPVDYLTEDRENIVKESVEGSEAYIKALLNLSQTFAIVVNSNLFVRRTKLQNQPLEGKFITDQRPLGFLKAQRGLVKEYVCKQDHDKFVTYVDNLKVANYAFETTDYTEAINITSNKDSGNPYRISDVYEITLARHILI